MSNTVWESVPAYHIRTDILESFLRIRFKDNSIKVHVSATLPLKFLGRDTN